MFQQGHQKVIRRLGLSAQKIVHTNGQLELLIEQAKDLDVLIVGGVHLKIRI